MSRPDHPNMDRCQPWGTEDEYNDRFSVWVQRPDGEWEIDWAVGPDLETARSNLKASLAGTGCRVGGEAR